MVILFIKIVGKDETNNTDDLHGREVHRNI